MNSKLRIELTDFIYILMQYHSYSNVILIYSLSLKNKFTNL